MDTSLDDERDEGPEPAPSRRRNHRARQVIATTALTVGMAAGGFGIAARGHVVELDEPRLRVPRVRRVRAVPPPRPARRAVRSTR